MKACFSILLGTKNSHRVVQYALNLPGFFLLSIKDTVTLGQHYCSTVYVHFVNRAPVSNNFEMNDAWVTKNTDVMYWMLLCCICGRENINVATIIAILHKMTLAIS